MRGPRLARRWGAFLVAVALAVPTAVLASVPGTTDASAGQSGTALSAIAAEIQALPWAARSGYSAAAVAGAVDPTPTTGTVLVHLTLAPSSWALYDAPPAGRAPLSVGAIAADFGRSPGQYQALEQYFTGFGLSVVHADPTRLSLSVEGPAGAVAAAFDTTLENGTLRGASVQYPTTVPELPAVFANEVTAISGLSGGLDRFTLPLTGAAPVRDPSDQPARSTDQVTPTAAHLAYGFNALYNFSGGTHFATGQAIVLLLWGDGFDPSDLQTFFQQDYPSGFPSVDIRWYPIDQATTPNASALNDPSQAPRELTLDIEWAGSMAPGATLDAVYAPDGPASHGYSPTDATMEDALSAADALSDVRAISMSFGTPDGADPSFQAAFESGFAIAAQRGITVLAASGDNGGLPLSGTCPAGGPAAQYPAASPQVLAVGGTAPTFSQSVLGGITGLAGETAWNGSGGGFSPTYAAPSWQSLGSAGAVVTPEGMRGIPDVAGPAQYDRFYYAGGLMAGNGTSFAAPFWAGLVTEMDSLLTEPLGELADRLYTVAAAEENGTKAPGLVGVQGQSGPACRTAGPGYNLVTGWGSPRAGPLFEDLEDTFVDVSLSAGPSPVAPGGTVTAVVGVTNATSHNPIGDLAVTLRLDASDGYFGPCGGTMVALARTTNASGNLSGALTIPECYFGTTAIVVVTVLSGGYFGNVSTTVDVNLLGLAGFLSAIQYYPTNVAAFIVIMGTAIAAGVFLGRPRPPRRSEEPEPPTAGTPPPTAGSTAPTTPAPEPVLPPATAPEPGTPAPADGPGAAAGPAPAAPAPPIGATDPAAPVDEAPESISTGLGSGPA